LWLGVDADVAVKTMVSWELMYSIELSTTRLTVAAAACAVLLAIGVPLAAAAPTVDGWGYVDSTARCTAPDTAVVFGSTATSRVAVCKTSDGQYEYRGVRVRDGAKLIVPASQSGDGGFVAENDGIAYTVTEDALVVSAGSRVIRDEPMVDFHTAQTPEAPPETPTPTTPLPPPLPAEVGGDG
jgi:hypothetical protein